MSSDPRTQAYVARPTEEGLTKGEIIRVLKCYVAREVYRYLRPGLELNRSGGGPGPIIGRRP